MVGRHFTDDDLLAHIEGELGRSDSERLEAALEGNYALRRRYDEQKRLVMQLREAPSSVDDIDVVDRLRERRRRGAAAPPRPRWPMFAAAAGALAVAAGVLFVVQRGPGTTTAEFTAKSDADRAPEKRWSGIQVLSVDAGGGARPAGDEIRPDSALVFSYINIGPKPFRYLMIFGVDERGECYWYHPAYEDASTNPRAVEIRRGEADVVLAERIEHSLPKGRYVIHAVFMNEARTVAEVEQRLAHSTERFTAWKDAVDQTVRLTVRP